MSSHENIDRRSRSDRGVAPIASVLLVLLVVLLAGGVAATLTTAVAPAEPAPTVALSMTVEGAEVTVVHETGDSLDVSRLRAEIRVDGEPLAEQPPLPFFSASGFSPGPTGAFNRAGSTTLRPGDHASFRIAATNDPVPAAGSTVELRLYRGPTPVATLTATAT